jgi:3-hydroxymyristoyl/3-hydroxydecanoyl-(acyl carrier protein) dehydratase
MAEAPRLLFAVPADHPVLRGHFPGRPIVPGVMLLEWVLEAAARDQARAPASLRVREAKFFTPLAPAQRAELLLEPGERRCGFRVMHGDVLIARGLLEWDADG